MKKTIKPKTTQKPKKTSKTKNTKDSTALVVGGLPKGLSLIKSEPIKEQNSLFLPSLRVSKSEKERILYIHDDDDVTKLENPSISLVVRREFARKLEGKSYTERCYSQIKTDEENESLEQWKEINAEEDCPQGWQKGYTFIVVVHGEEKATICTWELVGADVSYFEKCLKKGMADQSKVTRFKITDHQKNLKESKNLYLYLNAYKVKSGLDFEDDDMTKEELERVAEAYDEQKDQIEYFLNK